MPRIKRSVRLNQKQTRSEICVAINHLKTGMDGITGKFYDLVDVILALQNENEQLRAALQAMEIERANPPRREAPQTFRGKAIE